VSLVLELEDPLPIAPVELSEPVVEEPVPVAEGSPVVEPVDPVPIVSLELEDPVPPIVLESLEVEPVDEPVPRVSWLLPVVPLDCPEVELSPVAPVPCACAGDAAARIAATPRPDIVPHPNHLMSNTLRRSGIGARLHCRGPSFLSAP
jgi:hypothetical protein